MSSNNIVVAVRVRPFNKSEIKAKDNNVIEMSGRETRISCEGREHKFVFDHSFWSFDGYRINDSGYVEPDSPVYVDQRRLFLELGHGVLENAWKGYNCTLFAYGQTGSGKTYSVMGYEENRGIIPLLCEELFKKINEKIPSLKPTEKFRISMGILEIYNEKLRDLLNPTSSDSLPIKQNPEGGFYVPSQSMLQVNSYIEILQKIHLANKHRTIAKTKMNETSSRAHTVVTIKFSQIFLNPKNILTTKVSLINLVDLAGSEKVKKSGAEGDRLFEAQNINKSLSHLGNCLRALSKKETHVPFRDSVLTKLLMNALGGNSKTVLLVSISPSQWNFEETLSTLRFAERAKTIVTNAKINISESDKVIKSLQEENFRLLELLKELQSNPQKTITVENTKKINELQDQIDRNSMEVKELTKSYTEQLEQAKAELEKQKKEEIIQKQKLKEYPHLYNLNDDPSLNKVLIYFFDKPVTKIGNSKALEKFVASEAVDIVINGINILPLHAEIYTNEKDKSVIIRPISNAVICVNGETITNERKLNHFDRVLLGDSLFFFFFDPNVATNGSYKDKEPNIDDARREVAGKSIEFQNMENERLVEELSKYLPLVHEANTMANEMKRKVVYNLIILKERLIGYNNSNESKVVVQVIVTDKQREYFVELDEFTFRRFTMIDMYNKFLEGEDNENVNSPSDPFIPKESYPVCIGFSEILLEPLVFSLNIDQPVETINYKGKIVGEVDIRIDLCLENWDEINYESTEQLKEEADVFIKITLKSFTFKEDFFIGFSKICCHFKFENQIYKSNKMNVTNRASVFNQEFRIEKRNLDRTTLDYLSTHMMGVEIWGYYSDDLNAGTPVPPNGDLIDTDNEKFINDLVELIKQRQAVGKKSIKISSIRKIAPEKNASSSACSIQ